MRHLIAPTQVGIEEPHPSMCFPEVNKAICRGGEEGDAWEDADEVWDVVPFVQTTGGKETECSFGILDRAEI
ncbi:hypothetical protein JTE90_001251 [Oedothorax gibbosus]|uniref:Uncharacterized protein n=1 Tax=Oedothorax gibbosus TaxID=931172 RepID=A0AAV6VU08_9ARAC|nr:hypothetical protein JTE90_001251 [Oedothorax gibbosus]